MEYAAIVLAVVGLVTGIMFRLRVLLALVALLFLASVAVGVGSGFGFLKTLLTVLAAQTILQTSYFLGLVVAAIFSSAGHQQRVRSDYAALRPRSAEGRRRTSHGF
jgi:hypothetical protein